MRRLAIVSHNALWFQGAPYRSDRPGPADAAILSRLARIYRQLRADLLCLQEIQDEATFRAISAKVAMDGTYCLGGELAQYGGAVFFRKGDLVADSRSTGAKTQRTWQVVELGSLVLANVHLPSSRQLGEAVASERRIAELARLLAREPRPSVLAGDFNEQPGGTVEDFLRGRGFLDAAVAVGKADRPTALGGGRGDYVWVHQSLGERLIEYGVMDAADLAFSRPGKTSLSDHLPVRVALALED